MKFVKKVCVFDTISSGINALSVAFYIIFFYFVNQELCHVFCDEAKSRYFVPVFVFIVEIVMKVSNNDTVLLLKINNYEDNNEIF